MSLKLSRLFANLLIIGSLSLGAWGCSSSSDDGGGGATGSAGSSASSSKPGSGGSSGVSSSAGGASGGASSSSKASGGSSAVGGSSEVGGSSSGGKTTESTGTGTGGSSKGGTGTGTGTGTGGTVKGGTTGTGGTGTGTGTGTGGTAKGGTTATGGTATGGAVTGGTATGGAATGGSAAGGAGGSTGTGKTSPGCGSASPLKSGSFKEKINNVDRQWILDVPSGYDNTKPTRLIFVWHPLMGNADQVAQGGYNGLKSLSNNSTIFVAPNGLNGSNNEASGNGWWNKDDVDMKFLEAMLKKINEGLCIDQERIFTTGFSFGGMMSYTTPFVFNVFRATAPCSGKTGVIPYTDKVSDPIPIMAFHGNNDGTCQTALGKEFFEKFRVRNKCGTETKAISPSPCVEYQGCAVPTIWCLFSGGHMQWSEEPAAIWKFFSQF